MLPLTRTHVEDLRNVKSQVMASLVGAGGRRASNKMKCLCVRRFGAVLVRFRSVASFGFDPRRICFLAALLCVGIIWLGPGGEDVY